MRVTIRDAPHWIEQCNGVAIQPCNFFVRRAESNESNNF